MEIQTWQTVEKICGTLNYTDVVQFPSGLGGNDIIGKTFKGPIHQQLRDALQYIQNVIITEKVVKYPDRAEADRRYRNRRIGDFLKELHLTEGRNTGFKKILDALGANGSPKPEFVGFSRNGKLGGFKTLRGTNKVYRRRCKWREIFIREIVENYMKRWRRILCW